MYLSKTVQFIIMMAILIALAVSVFVEFPAKQRLQYVPFDTFNKINPRPATNNIVIVDIDEESLRYIGQWPWSRDVMGRLVTSMKDYSVKATVFDMVFAENDRTSPHLMAEELGVPIEALRNNDQAFADGIKDAGNVVTGFVVAKEGQTRRKPYVTQPVKVRKGDKDALLGSIYQLKGAATNLPEFPSNAAGNGIFLATPSTDGIIREIPLLVNFDGTIYPTLALEALRVAGDKREFLKIGPNKNSDAKTEYQIQVGEQGLVIPIERDGKIRVRYRSMSNADYISAYKIMDSRYDAEVWDKLNGKIAFIGTSAEGLKDVRSTPLNIFIPGVEIHANVAEQIIQGDYIYRHRAIAEQLEALFLVVIGCMIIILSFYIGVVTLLFLTAFAIFGGLLGALHVYVDHG